MTTHLITPPNSSMTYEVTLSDDGNHLVQVRKLRPNRHGYGVRPAGHYLQTIKPNSQNWRRMVRMAMREPTYNTSYDAIVEGGAL